MTRELKVYASSHLRLRIDWLKLQRKRLKASLQEEYPDFSFEIVNILDDVHQPAILLQIVSRSLWVAYMVTARSTIARHMG